MSLPHPDLTPVQDLVTSGIAALKTGDKSKAFANLTTAVQLDPKNEAAWIWLSGVCARDAERKFCMERVLETNPYNGIARSALNRLPADVRSESPLPKRLREPPQSKCAYPGCQTPLSNPKLKYCYKHWLENKSQSPSEPASASSSKTVCATAVGDRFNLSSRRINLILAELGWITRERKGWIPTSQGQLLGAIRRDHEKTRIPFVLWPAAIVENRVLLNTINDFNGGSTHTSNAAPAQPSDFRSKFPAKHRAIDGHLVRSRAELLIDNWLYMSGIVHAYERQLPIEEDAYCDFYIPNGKVYIEYWGLERDTQYRARMNSKREVYQKHDLDLIELTDEHIRNVDDSLPKMLLKYGIVPA